LAVERRAEIVKPDDLPTFDPPAAIESEPAEIVDEPCLITVSTSGNIARSDIDGGKLATAGRHDLLACSAATSTATTISAVTSEGRAFPIRGADLPDVAGRTRGTAVAQILGLNKGEEVVALVSAEDPPIALVTSGGIAKRVSSDEVISTKAGRTIIGLKGSDRVVAAFPAPDDSEVVMVASDGQALRTDAASISTQGRGAGGVAGMKLKAGASVVAASTGADSDLVIAVTSDSGIKTTPVAEIPVKGRNTQGVRLTRLAKGESVTVAAVGSGIGLLSQMSADDDPRKLDPHPVPLWVEPTRRDLVAATTERQIRVIAKGRW